MESTGTGGVSPPSPAGIALGVHHWTGIRGSILDPETWEPWDDEGEWLLNYQPSPNHSVEAAEPPTEGPADQNNYSVEVTYSPRWAYKPLTMARLREMVGSGGEGLTSGSRGERVTDSIPVGERYSRMIHGEAFKAVHRSDGTVASVEREILRVVDDPGSFREGKSLAKWALKEYKPTEIRMTRETVERCDELAALAIVKLPKGRKRCPISSIDLSNLLLLIADRTTEDGTASLTHELIAASLGWVDGVGPGLSEALVKRVSRLLAVVMAGRDECVLPLVRGLSRGRTGDAEVARRCTGAVEDLEEAMSQWLPRGLRWE